MNKLKSLLWVALFATIAFSCSDDEAVVDVRAQAVGTYTYTAKYYDLNSNGTLSYWGAADDETGTFTVSSDASNNAGMIFKEGSVEAFKIEKIAAADNGFTFDVPSQTFNSDGFTFTVTGYDGYVLTTSAGGSTKYNGAYIKAENKIDLYFQFSGVVIELICIKK